MTSRMKSAPGNDLIYRTSRIRKMFLFDFRGGTFRMENIIVVFLLFLAIRKADLLSGKGVCKNEGRLRCCYGHIERGSFCIPCPIGYYGQRCTILCPDGKFGDSCSKECHCSSSEICHPIHGCTDERVYLNDNSSTTTIDAGQKQEQKTSNSQGATISDKINPPCLNQDEAFKISHADMITYGALFAIIVLVVTNIIISKTHVMEVKHEIYPIIEDCYGSIVSKPRISGKKLARESKRQIAKQLSAMIDKSSRSRDLNYQNVELAGGFMNNLTNDAKTKQTVMEDFQNGAQEFIPENVMDNKEYFSIDEV